MSFINPLYTQNGPALGTQSAAVSSRRAKKAGFLVISAVLFNAFLALINGHVMPLNGGIVTLFQGFILALAGFFVLANQRQLKGGLAPVAFLLASFFLFVVVSIANQTFSLKSLGDMAIIGIFFILGGLADEKSIIKTFKILCFIILAFMFLEMASTGAYVSIFHPADYYKNTRGLEQSQFNDTGLFANALGYEGRFSFRLTDHRIASVFLEQVSLSGFAMVLSMIVMAVWKSLSRFEKLLFAGTILLAVVGTSSRTGTFFVLCLLPGYYIFPRLPQKGAALILPVSLMLTALFFYDSGLNKSRLSDNLSGRIGLTLATLSNLEIGDLLTGNVYKAFSSMDSGYTYLICSQTVFGLILFWLFLSLSLSASSPQNKRYLYFMNSYFAVCLLTGAAVLSIKTNAPLWLIAGYLQNSRVKHA